MAVARSRHHGTLIAATRYAAMEKKFFSIVVVRSIEESVEIVVEAPSADDAHVAAIQHLKAKGDEYNWQKPRKDLTVWHKREIDTPAIIDVSA